MLLVSVVLPLLFKLDMLRIPRESVHDSVAVVGVPSHGSVVLLAFCDMIRDWHSFVS